MGTPFSESAGIPVNDRRPIVAYSSVVLDIPGRPVPLEVKATAPATGRDLPVILLSHGHGSSNFLSSSHGYSPVAEFWAAHGFLVLQPTHLDSTTLGLQDSDIPEAPLFWRSRAEDLRHILDHLSDIEATVPALAGRVDREAVAVVGHSLGGHSAAMLLGMRTADPADGATVDLTDPRVKAGVLLAPPGLADDQSGPALERYPVLGRLDFSEMATPALVVAGGKDLNPAFSRRLSYRWDAYTASPGPKTLVTIPDAGHIFGGISGFDSVETSDEDPDRVALVRALIWAWLTSALRPGDDAWPDAVAALRASSTPAAVIEAKG